MRDNNVYMELRSSDIAMEGFQDMAISQEGRNRIKYIDIVTEAFSNPTKQATLLNKLFKDIQKVEEIEKSITDPTKGKSLIAHDMFMAHTMPDKYKLNLFIML